MIWLKWLCIALGGWCLLSLVVTPIICWLISRGKERDKLLEAQWRREQEAAGIPAASKHGENQLIGRSSLF
jgi:hypothetical protein